MKPWNRLAGGAGLLTIAIALSALSPAGLAQTGGEASRLLPLPPPHKGLSFNLHWDSDIYANVDGGARRGYATDSVASAQFGLNTGALGAWQGGQLNIGLQAITSTHPSAYVGDLQTVSNLDAPNQNQVAQFWYSQQVGPNTVRGGIIDLNSFFDVTDSASLFTNASFGITPTMTVNVPTATYPDPGWGLMAQLGKHDDNWQVGVFQGNPARRSSALHEGTMLIAERGWRNTATGSHFGIGAWYRQVPASGGLPTHDWGMYSNFEHALPGHPDTVAFVQAGVSPGEVNAVPGYLAAGVHFDNVSTAVSEWGVGFARAWIRGHSAETSVETTALIPFDNNILALQPDVQYVFHPSGVLPNALVFALRLHMVLY
jgi:porin